MANLAIYSIYGRIIKNSAQWKQMNMKKVLRTQV